MASPLLFALQSLWAALVGASVAAQVALATTLNSRSEKPMYHAFYITNIAVVIGGLILTPRSLQSPAPVHKPKYWWSCMGGMCALTSFFCIPASAALGVQLVLLTQLVAMLSTALIFDIRRGRVALSDWRRLLGLAVVLLGTGVDSVFAKKGSSGTSISTTTTVLLMLGVASAGIGYALQAKCNGRLARDLGATSRATLVSAIVGTLCALPIDAVLLWDFDVPLVVHGSDWWLWLLTGVQSAFYIGSLAVLPKALGYTASYLALLAGKLAASSAVDAWGLTGHAVPFDLARAISLLFVFTGAGLFSVKKVPDEEIQPDNSPAGELGLESELPTGLINGGEMEEARQVAAVSPAQTELQGGSRT